MLTLLAMTSLNLVSATQHNRSSANEESATASVQTVVQPINVSTGEACNADATGKQVRSIEGRDIKEGASADSSSMLTSKNILVGVSGLIGLLIVLLLIRNIIRVR